MCSGDYRLPDTPHFLWVTEFPLFTKDKDKEFLAKGRWSSTHHPFTAPMWQDIDAMYAGRTDSVRGQHYDLVLNGVEIGGGSVRVHDADMQQYIFKNILQVMLSNLSPSLSPMFLAHRCRERTVYSTTPCPTMWCPSSWRDCIRYILLSFDQQAYQGQDSIA